MAYHKILASADWHFSNASGVGIIDKGGINSFLRVKESVFNEMIDYAVKFKYKIIVIAGDWLDGAMLDSFTMQALHRCIKRLMKYKIYTIVLTGNHEFDGVNSVLSAYGDLDMSRMFFVSKPDVLSMFGISFYCIPYIGKSASTQCEIVERFIGKCANDNNKKILLFHYPVIGCKYDSGHGAMSGFNLKAVLNEHGNPFDFILAGDFHDRQRLDGVPNFLYLGQPYWGDFDSIGKSRGFSAINLKSGKVRLIRPETCPQFLVLNKITKASDINGDLTNKIVKINIYSDTNSAPIYDRCYDLGAIKVLIKRKPKKKGEISPTIVKGIDREGAIIKYAGRQKQMNVTLLTKIGLGVYGGVHKRMHDEETS